MAVAHESDTESHTGTTGSTSQASFDFSVPFTSSTKGILVFTFVNANANDAVTVRIDPTGANIDVPAVTGGRAVDISGEPGDCKAWFRGSGLPTTTTTVRVNRTNNANVMYAVAILVTANGNTQIQGTPVLMQNDGTWAQQTVGTAGVQSQGYAGGNYGGSDPPVIGANSTVLQTIDFGNRSISTARETSSPGSTGTKLVGWTSISDDRAAVHLAISEVPGGPTIIAVDCNASGVGASTAAGSAFATSAYSATGAAVGAVAGAGLNLASASADSVSGSALVSGTVWPGSVVMPGAAGASMGSGWLIGGAAASVGAAAGSMDAVSFGAGAASSIGVASASWGTVSFGTGSALSVGSAAAPVTGTAVWNSAAAVSGSAAVTVAAATLWTGFMASAGASSMAMTSVGGGGTPEPAECIGAGMATMLGQAAMIAATAIASESSGTAIPQVIND